MAQNNPVSNEPFIKYKTDSSPTLFQLQDVPPNIPPVPEDFALQYGEQTFKIHLMNLSLLSNRARKIALCNPCFRSIIYPNTIKDTTIIVNFIKFLYGNYPNITHENLMDWHKLAIFFEVPQLLISTSQLLKETLTISEATRRIKLYLNNNSYDLVFLQAEISYLAEHFTQAYNDILSLPLLAIEGILNDGFMQYYYNFPFYQWISSLGIRSPEYYSLFASLHFEYFSKEIAAQFASEINQNALNGSLWENIKNRYVMHSQIPMNSITPKQFTPIKQILSNRSSNSNLTSPNLNNSNITSPNLNNTNLNNSNITSPNLNNTNLNNTNLNKIQNLSNNTTTTSNPFLDSVPVKTKPIKQNLLPQPVPQLAKPIQQSEQQSVQQYAKSIPYKGDFWKGIFHSLKDPNDPKFLKSVKLFAPQQQHNIYNLLNIDDPNSWNNWDAEEKTFKKEDAWFIIQFLQIKVHLTSFSIAIFADKSDFFQPKHFILYGSNDKNTWDIIDEEKNATILNCPNPEAIFDIDPKNKKFYKYFKFQMIENFIKKNTPLKKELTINCIEFFGDIQPID